MYYIFWVNHNFRFTSNCLNGRRMLAKAFEGIPPTGSTARYGRIVGKSIRHTGRGRFIFIAQLLLESSPHIQCKRVIFKKRALHLHSCWVLRRASECPTIIHASPSQLVRIFQYSTYHELCTRRGMIPLISSGHNIMYVSLCSHFVLLNLTVLNKSAKN